ncbi:IclR family transcriptional regulator [Martelella sp. HB161492]|uniref:IclR family transcriptional regulator n=1 Tax=Martelella sp. HB161492 TaxID=2720726 RepID=UPI0015917105|nr:IclR family transcriptional regulator [Martelella sp. HB161492]
MPIIQSVQRALMILNLFDEENPEMKITDIAARLDLHKSTLHSILKTLQMEGYIEQNHENGRYRLGMKLVERGTFVINSLDLRKRAGPALAALSQATGETVHLGILEGKNGVYIDKVDGSRALIGYSRIGRSLPIHCTAIGKVLLAFRPTEEVWSLLGGYDFTAFTERTITAAEPFVAALSTVRAEGLALDDEEHSRGVRCMAAPVFDHDKKVVAAVSISTLTSVTDSAAFARLIAPLKQASAAISLALGDR